VCANYRLADFQASLKLIKCLLITNICYPFPSHVTILITYDQDNHKKPRRQSAARLLTCPITISGYTFRNQNEIEERTKYLKGIRVSAVSRRMLSVA
jgi:hypothetical protein